MQRSKVCFTCCFVQQTGRISSTGRTAELTSTNFPAQEKTSNSSSATSSLGSDDPVSGWFPMLFLLGLGRYKCNRAAISRIHLPFLHIENTFAKLNYVIWAFQFVLVIADNLNVQNQVLLQTADKEFENQG